MKNGPYILVKAPEEFPGKRYRGKYCYEHHLSYWLATGTVPSESEIIHHIDGNKHNNDISNLKLETRSKHTVRHNLDRGRGMATFRCPTCGKIFQRERRNSHLTRNRGLGTFCSRNCSGKFASFSVVEKSKRLEGNIVNTFNSKDI